MAGSEHGNQKTDQTDEAQSSVDRRKRSYSDVDSRPSWAVFERDADGLVRLWSPDLRDIPVSSMHLDSEVTVLRWSVDGERLAMGTTTGGLVIADLVSGKLV